MYHFFLSIQWAGIVILTGEIIYMLQKKASSVKSLLLLMDFFILINYVGYYFELKSETQAMALEAVKIIYVGKPFIALTVLLAIMECCRVRLPKWLKNLLAAMHITITLLVFTCEHNNLFYSGIGWTEEGIYPHLVLGHGPVYIIYSAILFLYFLLILAVVIRRYRIIKNRYEKKQLYILAAMVAVVIAGFIWYLSGTTEGYDTTLPAYLIAVIMLSVALLRYRLLDTVDFAKEDALDFYKDALIVVNNEDQLLYSNHRAKELRGEFEAGKKDIQISHLKELAEQKSCLFLEKRAYQTEARPIQRDGIEYGTLLIVSDITDQYYYAERLAQEVREKTEEVVTIQRSVLTSLASMIEARDGITGLHIKNTSRYVQILVEAILRSDPEAEILSEEKASAIIAAAPLHDIGKIAVPDQVLKKPGKLTEEEFAIIKKHPAEGARIIDETLQNVESDMYLEVARQMACYHHEKWDGTGYPCGLKGEEIPLCARIMAIADVYDALLSKRSYKEAYTPEKAAEIMRESSGSHFDPKLVKLFLDQMDGKRKERICIDESKMESGRK